MKVKEGDEEGTEKGLITNYKEVSYLICYSLLQSETTTEHCSYRDANF